MSVRAAVVGAGAFGRQHIRAIQELQDVELKAVVEPRSEARVSVAVSAGTEWLESVEGLRGKVDCAIVDAVAKDLSLRITKGEPEAWISDIVQHNDALKGLPEDEQEPILHKA